MLDADLQPCHLDSLFAEISAETQEEAADLKARIGPLLEDFIAWHPDTKLIDRVTESYDIYENVKPLWMVGIELSSDALRFIAAQDIIKIGRKIYEMAGDFQVFYQMQDGETGVVCDLYSDSDTKANEKNP